MLRSATNGLCSAGLVLAIVSGCGGTATHQVTQAKAPAQPSLLSEQARQDIQVGWIRSLAPRGRGYKLVFDLAILLGGPTGVQACVDNGQCPRSERHDRGFPDDWIAGDLHFVLPYYLPPTAKIAFTGNPTPLAASARELYSAIHGKDPRHLIERSGMGSPKDSLWWIQTKPGGRAGEDPLDSVVRMEQQYHP